MAPALKWFLVAAGVVLLLFFLFPLLRATDEDFIDTPAAPASDSLGAAPGDNQPRGAVRFADRRSARESPALVNERAESDVPEERRAPAVPGNSR